MTSTDSMVDPHPLIRPVRTLPAVPAVKACRCFVLTVGVLVLFTFARSFGLLSSPIPGGYLSAFWSQRWP